MYKITANVEKIKALRVNEVCYLRPTETQQNGRYMIRKVKRDEYVIYEMMFGDRLISGTAQQVCDRAFRDE